MVEQAHAGECHDHVVFVAALYHKVVADGAAGLCDIFYSAALCSFDIVAEREERVRAERYAVYRSEICLDFLVGQRLGAGGEIFLPVALGADIFFVFVDVAVNDIVPVGAAYRILKREVQDFFVLAQEPGVCLCACEAGAVDSRLLTRCSGSACMRRQSPNKDFSFHEKYATIGLTNPKISV